MHACMCMRGSTIDDIIHLLLLKTTWNLLLKLNYLWFRSSVLKLHTWSNWADIESYGSQLILGSLSLETTLHNKNATACCNNENGRLQHQAKGYVRDIYLLTTWKGAHSSAQENRLSCKLKEKSGEIMKRLYNHHAGHLAVSHPECMVSPRPTYSRPHSEPLSRASDLLPTYIPALQVHCVPWYLHWQAGLTHNHMWRTPGSLWRWWKTWGLKKMRCWSALTCPPCTCSRTFQLTRHCW